MKSVILDTDIGTDSDDVGALMVLHSFIGKGEAVPLCVTSCTSRRDGAAAVDAINRWYGREIEVGQWKKPFHCGPEHGGYSRAITLCFENSFRDRDARDAVPLLREKLAAATEKVTFITVGPLNVIAALLESEPDNYSPLCGKELAESKAEEFFVMGGRFDCAETEWNIKSDIESARTAVRILSETGVKTVFIPWETGARVRTGDNVLNGPYSPMKLAYYVHNDGPRESWDPLTVYAALCGEGLTLSDKGNVTVDENGVTALKVGKGNMCYVLPEFDVESIRLRLEAEMKP